jgi:DNA-binding transcriptional ArsR family regulator
VSSYGARRRNDAAASDQSNTLCNDAEGCDFGAELLKAVAHPLRLRIVAILCAGEEQVNALAEKLKVAPAIVSQQLRLLRMRNLVRATRANGFVRYRIAEPRLHTLVKCLEGCVQDHRSNGRFL